MTPLDEMEEVVMAVEMAAVEEVAVDDTDQGLFGRRMIAFRAHRYLGVCQMSRRHRLNEQKAPTVIEATRSAGAD